MKYLSFLTLLIFFACSSSKNTEQKANLLSEINKQETELKNDPALQVNKVKGEKMIKAYLDFSDSFPKDSLAAKYIFKAGEVSMGIAYYSKAIELFEKVNSQYPNYKKAPESLFLVAFIYDTYLNQLDKAKIAYQKVIDKYPNHHLTRDAKLSIEHLGMSDEELIKMFEEKQKEES